MIFTPSVRQKKILEILSSGDRLARNDIMEDLSKEEEVSRPTLIRDLNELLEHGLIETEGAARATVYFAPSVATLLNYIDIEGYFKKESFERTAQKSFNAEVFSKLCFLFDAEDKVLWEKGVKEFDKRSKELEPAIYKRELERFIIEFSWKSSQIEGNTYDLIESETLLKHHIEAKGHSREEALMIINHKKAFESILEHKEQFSKITISGITQLHGVLTRDMNIGSGFRNHPVGISGSAYEPLKYQGEIAGAMDKLVEVLNSTEYCPEKAFIASCMIGYIQPFEDGNKRTSRMLANAILLANGYFPLSYRSVDISEYRRAMIVFYEQNNLYHLKRVFVEQQKFAMDNYFLI